MMDSLVGELARLVRDESLVELTFEDQEHRLRMRSRRVPAPGSVPAPPPRPESVPPAEEEDLGGTPVTSSVVGLFHRADSRAGDPLVRVGDRIHQGQVLCFIESMSLTHEVRAPVDGQVLEILAEEGEPVEYGQALMLVDAL